jgi:hypothetical protein
MQRTLDFAIVAKRGAAWLSNAVGSLRYWEVSLRKVFLIVALVLVGIVPAAADMRIRGSAGGRIGDYLDMYQQVRASGERVIIDGPCLSACTLVLSIVPRNRICVTPRAVLGFHAAYSKDMLGREKTEYAATEAVMRYYPPQIRSWIRRRGGLTERTLLLRGRELAAMYRRCG